jgi:hypothetical protein
MGELVMTFRITRTAPCVTGALLAAFSSVHARPIVIEESTTVTSPDTSWEYFGRHVAVDGDWALVQGDRYIPDPNAETGRRHDGAALLFRKVNSSWSYVGILGAIDVVDEWTTPGLAMKNGVAMVIEKSVRVFERSGNTWTQAPIDIPQGTALQGPDIEIDGGRILVPRVSCNWESAVYSKVGSTWKVEGVLRGHMSYCNDNAPSAFQDLAGSRAIVFNMSGMNQDRTTMRMYRPSLGGWEEAISLSEPPPFSYVFGPEVALHASGAYVAASGSPESGTPVITGSGGGEGSWSWGWPTPTMRPIDSFMQPGIYSAVGLEHGGPYFFARNFSYDRNGYVINVYSVTPGRIYGVVNHLATLVARNGASLGRSIDVSGNRVIVGGRDNFDGNNTVRVFELPTSFVATPVRQDDFEQTNAGADWEPVAGSSFSVVVSGNWHVYRQTNVAGNAASFLPASESNDQALQAEVTPRSFSGSDRWFGIATRQTDMGNYYYVTARSSGHIDLKRMVNGAFTTLASAPYPITVGRKYRLRLESIGTSHRVFVDDQLLLTAYDGALRHGRAGVIMYRTSADYDNVVITPSPLTTAFEQECSTEQQGRSTLVSGEWACVDGVHRQTYTDGGTRFVTGPPEMSDLIVQTRVRPTAFNGADRWVGLITHYLDDDDYIYVTLRGSNRVSLRRLVHGEIQTLGEQTLNVTPGTWYTLRMETVGNSLRMFVNGTLIASADGVGPPTGQIALATYKASADFDDFLAYQP